MVDNNLESASASISREYSISADELWGLVDFHQPAETIMPPIASSSVNGAGLSAIKVNQLDGGGEVVLQLVYYSPDDRAFNYIIKDSPLPVDNYVGEVRVAATGENKSELSWSGKFTANGVSGEEASSVIQGFYESIAGRIAEITA